MALVAARVVLRGMGTLLLAWLAAAPMVADAQSLLVAGDPAVPVAAPVAGPLFTPLAPAAPAMADSDRDRAADCMSWAIAYEAANQPVAGQEAVGQVILNRLRDPRRPKTVCGVVFEGAERRTGCQFSFTCDGSLRHRMSDQTMVLARSIALSVLDGLAPDHVGAATHYHADYVLPAWAADGRRVAQIGAHIFYEMPGDAARIGRVSLAGGEPDYSAMVAAPVKLARRSRRMPGYGLAQAAPQPTATHSLFQPWGLPVAGQ